MRPAVGAISRAMQRATVDLPEPDSPTMPTISPASTRRSTPSTAGTAAPPPPMPFIHGSRTPSASEVATAASTALPPARSSSAPAPAARTLCAATSPPPPVPTSLAKRDTAPRVFSRLGRQRALPVSTDVERPVRGGGSRFCPDAAGARAASRRVARTGRGRVFSCRFSQNEQEGSHMHRYHTWKFAGELGYEVVLNVVVAGFAAGLAVVAPAAAAAPAVPPPRRMSLRRRGLAHDQCRSCASRRSCDRIRNLKGWVRS